MIFVLIGRDRIHDEWARMLPLLEKAIGYDENATPDDVKDWLLSGRSEAFWIGIYPNATGIGVTTTDDEVCFINYVAGTVEGGPRKFVKTARIIVNDIEELARKAGCKELRGGGRNWSRVFPDWERFDPEHPNRMRKVISHG